MLKSTFRKAVSSWAFVIVPALALMLIPPKMLHAQLAGQGQITGRVTDTTGAVIPHATVTITNSATGGKMIRSSSASGIYLASPLNPGTYQVTASAKGFATAVQKNITVNGTESVGLDIKMHIGTQSQTITVSAAPPMLKTTDASLGAIWWAGSCDGR